LSYASGEPQS